MVIDLDIHIDLHYQSTSVCRVRFVTIELEKNQGRYRLTSDQKLSLVVFEHDKDEGPLYSGGTVVKFGPA